MFRPSRTLWALLVLLSACLAAAAWGESPTPGKADAADKTLSPYFMVVSDEPGKDVMPLKSTRADVKIAGMVAEVKITQVYKNTGKKPWRPSMSSRALPGRRCMPCG